MSVRIQAKTKQIAKIIGSGIEMGMARRRRTRQALTDIHVLLSNAAGNPSQQHELQGHSQNLSTDCGHGTTAEPVRAAGLSDACILVGSWWCWVGE